MGLSRVDRPAASSVCTTAATRSGCQTGWQGCGAAQSTDRGDKPAYSAHATSKLRALWSCARAVVASPKNPVGPRGRARRSTAPELLFFSSTLWGINRLIPAPASHRIRPHLLRLEPAVSARSGSCPPGRSCPCGGNRALGGFGAWMLEISKEIRHLAYSAVSPISPYSQGLSVSVHQRRLCHQFGFVGSPGKALFCLSFLESGQKW
jgi:hypothetical protein